MWQTDDKIAAFDFSACSKHTITRTHYSMMRYNYDLTATRLQFNYNFDSTATLLHMTFRQREGGLWLHSRSPC